MTANLRVSGSVSAPRQGVAVSATVGSTVVSRWVIRGLKEEAPEMVCPSPQGTTSKLVTDGVSFTRGEGSEGAARVQEDRLIMMKTKGGVECASDLLEGRDNKVSKETRFSWC